MSFSNPAENTESFEVSFPDLGNFHATLASWLADVPGTMLELLHEAASEVVSVLTSAVVLDVRILWLSTLQRSVHDAGAAARGGQISGEH